MAVLVSPSTMGTLRTSTDFDDDRSVRSFARRARLGLMTVVAGSLAFCVIALGATHPMAGALPTGVLRGLVAMACAVVGVVLYIAVRRPLDEARLQAIALAGAERDAHDATLETFAALGAAVEAKDRHTAGHGLRVTLLSILIAQELGITEPELDHIRLAATFHDIGKIAVPDAVLQKPGRLTDHEFSAMKHHPVEGARICGKLASLREIAPLVRSHHERMDGRGYPDALRGEAIPLGARVIAVADAWDAITSDRPYRLGQPSYVALEEIRRCSGHQFDPLVVQALVEVLATDPWMFGLDPADLTADMRLLGSAPSAPRSVDLDASSWSELRSGSFITEIDEVERGTIGVDWATGFDENDIRAL